MYISKITVLITHEELNEIEGVEELIESAIAQNFAEGRISGTIEVRSAETAEVTLATIQSALEDGLISPAKDPAEK